MKDLIIGSIATITLLVGFYWFTRICIWAYTTVGGLVYGMAFMAFIWLCVSLLKKAGNR